MALPLRGDYPSSVPSWTPSAESLDCEWRRCDSDTQKPDKLDRLVQKASLIESGRIYSHKVCFDLAKSLLISFVPSFFKPLFFTTLDEPNRWNEWDKIRIILELAEMFFQSFEKIDHKPYLNDVIKQIKEGILDCRDREKLQLILKARVNSILVAYVRSQTAAIYLKLKLELEILFFACDNFFLVAEGDERSFSCEENIRQLSLKCSQMRTRLCELERSGVSKSSSPSVVPCRKEGKIRRPNPKPEDSLPVKELVKRLLGKNLNIHLISLRVPNEEIIPFISTIASASLQFAALQLNQQRLPKYHLPYQSCSLSFQREEGAHFFSVYILANSRGTRVGRLGSGNYCKVKEAIKVSLEGDKVDVFTQAVTRLRKNIKLYKEAYHNTLFTHELLKLMLARMPDRSFYNETSEILNFFAKQTDPSSQPLPRLEWYSYQFQGDLFHKAIQDKSWAPEKIIRAFQRVAQGLIPMHQEGFVHLDIKDSNILVDASQEATIGDFGFLSPIKFEVNSDISHNPIIQDLAARRSIPTPYADIWGVCLSQIMIFAPFVLIEIKLLGPAEQLQFLKEYALTTIWRIRPPLGGELSRLGDELRGLYKAAPHASAKEIEAICLSLINRQILQAEYSKKIIYIDLWVKLRSLFFFSEVFYTEAVKQDNLYTHLLQNASSNNRKAPKEVGEEMESYLKWSAEKWKEIQAGLELTSATELVQNLDLLCREIEEKTKLMSMP